MNKRLKKEPKLHEACCELNLATEDTEGTEEKKYMPGGLTKKSKNTSLKSDE